MTFAGFGFPDLKLYSFTRDNRSGGNEAFMRALAICFALLAAGPASATEVFVSDGDTLVLDGKIFRLDGIEVSQHIGRENQPELGLLCH